MSHGRKEHEEHWWEGVCKGLIESPTGSSPISEALNAGLSL